MPKKLEKALRATALRRGYDKATTNKYVYGTLKKLGWTSGNHKRKSS